MRALFLVNARSGVNRHRDMHALIRASCPEHEVVACERKEDLDDIVARAEADGFDAVVAVGGDGTVHETAKRLIGRRIALGVVPTGSGNGFARHIGTPMYARASILACRSARVETIDTVLVNDTAYIGTMGVGVDAAIAHAFASAGTRGLRTYVRVGIHELRRYVADEVEIEVDGERLTRRAFLIAAANATQYGNNVRIAPIASLQDGLIDVVIVDHVSLIGAAKMLPALFGGRFHRTKGVTFRQGRHVVIRRAAAGPAHVDGEPVTMDATLTVDIVPRSLNVLVPSGVERI
jgi:YegS/Rv2252/BmrU family lipid kinase